MTFSSQFFMLNFYPSSIVHKLLSIADALIIIDAVNTLMLYN